MDNNQSLPYGWVKQSDPSSGQNFYVDTKANPPRSIWTHPYEDEVFLREHPDIHEKVGRRQKPASGASTPMPPPYDAPLPRRRSFNDRDDISRESRKHRDRDREPRERKRRGGLIGRLKDLAADSMEKHDDRKRQQQQQLLMQQQQQQQMYGGQGGYGGGGAGMMGMPPNRYPAPQNAYPAGYGVGGTSMGGMGMGGGMGGMGMGGMGMGGMGGQRRGVGGGGMALPLLGGLAGGLLLGDVLDNDNNNNNGGDWGDGGGGDFGGGGGGDFDGGGGDF